MSLDRESDSSGAEADTVERLVADCLRRRVEADSETVAHICRDYPKHLDVVRRRIETLSNYGLLAEEPVSLAGSAPAVPGYRILSKLGSGGMGVVWLAEQEESGRRVALKTSDPRVPWTERMRERFRREVTAVSRLDHPHVVPIIEAGEAGGVPFFTMEYVEGTTLAEIIGALRESGARPDQLGEFSIRESWELLQGRAADEPVWGQSHVECVCRIGVEIAQALEHLHAHGVIHRDVKPANILLDPAGRARLFDLGLVHLDDQPALTVTGDFAGSPHYASPEQISGSARDLDGRTDVYSLGVTLYEALALHPPFRAANTPQLLKLIQGRDAPPLRASSADVPRDLETIVATCVEKKPAHRYASAQELAEDLARLRRFQPIRARPIGAARRALMRARRQPAWAVAGLLAVAALIAAPLGLWQHERSLRSERDRANRAAEEARREAIENRQSSEFLESLLLYMDESGAPGDRRTVHNLLAVATDRVEDASSAGATTRANLMTTVARVLSGMDRYEEAIPLLDRAFSIRQRELGEHDPETAEVLRRLALAHFAMGNRQEALALGRRALRAVEAGGSGGHPRAVEVQLSLATMLRETGAIEEASEHLDASLRALEASGLVASAQAARALRERGLVHSTRGEADEALEMTTAALELLRTLDNPPLQDVAAALEAVGEAKRAVGDAEGARTAWVESLGLQRKAAGDQSQRVVAVLERLTGLASNDAATDEGRLVDRARHLDLLARNYAHQGREEAGAVFEQALEAFGSPKVSSAADLGSCLAAYGDWAHDTGDTERARACFRRAFDLLDEPGGDREPWRLRCLQGLVELSDPDDPSVGERLDRGIAWLEEWSSPRDVEYADLLRRHAQLLAERGRTREASRLLLEYEGEELAGGESRVIYRLGSADSGAAFQEGITSLQAGRYESAAGAFRRCLDLRPQDSVAAYNLACAFALMGRSDAALEALGQAADAGFCYRVDAIESLRGDADLASLHEDPRFDALVARMFEQRERADRFASEAASWVPPSIEGLGSIGVLVVLHDAGETKDEIIAGPWRRVADELGYALLAPSGRVPVGIDPADGVRWAEDVETYADNPSYFERPVGEALQSFRERWPVDPKRILIAGHGLGGTLAFNVAIHSAEVYGGVVLVDAAVHDGLASQKAPHLGSMGLRAALLPDIHRVPAGVAPDMAPPVWAAQLFRQMREWEIGATIATWPSEERGADRHQVLVRAVRWLSGTVLKPLQHHQGRFPVRSVQARRLG